MNDQSQSHRRHGHSKSATLVLSLPLGTPAAGESLQRWLYDGLRQAILGGRLPADSILPGTRTLARQYGLARGTVLAVYEQLQSEGYLIARAGSSTRVSSLIPDLSLYSKPAPPRTAPPPTTFDQALRGPWIKRLVEHDPAFPLNVSDVPPHPFLPHRGDIRAFPMDVWRQLHVRQLRSSRLDSLRDAHPAGLPALRAAIAERLAIVRAVSVSPEQIVIVSSVQQALDLCMRLIAGPGDSVWMEDPGNIGARQVMLAAGAKIIDIAVDQRGMRVEDGLRDAPSAVLAYVTPSHQAPLGVCMSGERRMALLRWACEHDAIIFEDDYDSQYCFATQPIPALQSLPGGDTHVILSGTFSRLMFPALRLAFVALPARLVDPFKRATSITSRSANGLAQAVLADFLADGHFDRHVRRMNKIYAARSQAFEHAARRYWQGLIDIPSAQAGLDIVGRLVRLDETNATRRLAAAGIEASPLGRYTVRHAHPPSLVMGYAPFNEAEIDRAAQAIALALREAA